jgi:hypothetical protein
VTDLDGELERMRAETRHRLDSEQELEEKLAAYEKSLAPLAPPRIPEDVEEDQEAAEKPAPAETSVAAKAAGDVAKSAAKKVVGFSTPKLLATVVALFFGAWILERVIGPLVTLAIFAIVVLLGYRLLRWFVGGKEPAEEAGKDDAKDDED